MASIFGDDGVDDLLNNDIIGEQELPSGDEAGGDDDEKLFNENGEGEGDGDDAKNPVAVEPKKRIVRTRPRLTVDTLRGPRGLHTIEEYYKDIKLKGKGHEKEDLDEVLKRLQHWGHRLYPNYKFTDVLSQIEKLGHKKPLQVHMSRYRLGLLENMQNGLGTDDILEEDENAGRLNDEPFDEFDALLDEQIAISRLAPKTPASSYRQVATPSSLATPSFSRGNAVMSTPYSGIHQLDTSDLAQPLPPSQPETPQPVSKQLTAEQLARMAENRRIAQERLKAKRLEQARQQQAAEQTSNLL